MFANQHTIAIALAVAWSPSVGRAEVVELPGRVAACFVPQEDCETEIVARIDAAALTIRVQAYGFSDGRIIGALTAAAARGVDVQLILDRSNLRRRWPALDGVVRHGIPVWIDDVVGIAHTKAIIIDRELVIGGSYNYTVAAQARNAETVVFLRGAAVARPFLDNWDSRRAAATQLPATAAAAPPAAP